MEKMGVREALPPKSEPNIFLVETTQSRQNSPKSRNQMYGGQHHHQGGNEREFRIYFGYLVPSKVNMV